MAQVFLGKNSEIFLTEYEPFPGRADWQEYKHKYWVPSNVKGNIKMGKSFENYKSKVPSGKQTAEDTKAFVDTLKRYIEALKETSKGNWKTNKQIYKNQVYAELDEIVRRCENGKPTPKENPSFKDEIANRQREHQKKMWGSIFNVNHEEDEVSLQIEDDNYQHAPSSANDVQFALGKVSFNGEKEHDQREFAYISSILVPRSGGILHRDVHVDFLNAVINQKGNEAYKDVVEQGKSAKVDILRDLKELVKQKVDERLERLEKMESKVVGKSKHVQKSIKINKYNDEEEFWA